MGDKTRNYLAGSLRTEILALLNEAASTGGTIYTALFELDDPELESALVALGPKANVILANGSTTTSGGDENLAARTALAGKVQLYERMVPEGHLAHNKFMVLVDANGVPRKAWTGSTNWTKTGLCTQANNGLLIEDSQLASFFLNQWDLLKQAHNDYPTSLLQANSQRKSREVGKNKTTIWFAPVDAGEDLTDARALINGADEGILFLMFNPGPSGTLLNAIVDRNTASSDTYNPDLYIHGVLNQDPSTEQHPIVGLFHRGQYQPADFDVVLPAAITQQLAYWIPELKKFHNAWAMVHSKVIVIDPFGAHPVVMTGSHNMGPKVSSKNDDNLIIIENNPELAAAYAVNIISIYNQYRWRYLLSQQQQQQASSQQWLGLQDNDQWQDEYFNGAKLHELNFWLGQFNQK